jgi:RNase H-like domain found in reverse transcriptase
VDLKSRLATRPILRPPDYDKQFCLAVDASQFCVGSVLFQVTDDVEHPICYMSRKLKPHEVNYSTIEKEALALVVAVRACSVYFGSAPVIVYSDHSPLQFINTMRNFNQKLLRWSLELQQYSLEIRHRPGRFNLLPDLLSRPATEESEVSA